jgi:hypothetical protein
LTGARAAAKPESIVNLDRDGLSFAVSVDFAVLALALYLVL